MIVLSVALAALAAAAFGPSPALLAAFAVAAVAPPLTRVDVSEHRLPNRLVGPAAAAGLAGVGLNWATAGTQPLFPVLAATAYSGTLLALALVGGMGMGDVKLAAALGLASPTVSVAVLSPLLAFLLGGLTSAVLLFRRGRAARHDHIAFGPFMLAGYFAAVGIVAVGRLVNVAA